MLPFDGLRVIDLSEEIAGPYAAMLLAEQGADVVKIEPPAGDSGRRLHGFAVWNRSKTGAVCDFDSDDDRNQVERLLSLADVLVTSWGPAGAPEGMGPQPVLSRHPRLIHLWMPPYGALGPEADGFPDDALVAAAAGLLMGQPATNGGPVYLTIPFASYGAAFVGVGAAAAALVAREQTGRGQVVEVSWLAGALAMTTGSMINAAEGGVLRLMQANRSPLGALPSYRLYQCGDGEWLFLACGNSTFFNKMALAIGRPEIVSDERFQNAPWGIVDPDHRQALADLIGSELASRGRDAWLRIFESHDVPVAPVGSRREFIDDPQVIANGMRVEIEDPTRGSTVQMGVPLEIGETRAIPRKPAPMLREHALTALWTEVKARRTAWNRGTDDTKPPLAGLRVLDLSFYIAGPLGPMVLADYGADVIKVEPPSGDPFREIAIGFLGWNRGKRSIALDLTQPEGKEVLLELVRRADVLVENYRPGVTARLGIDYASLRSVNPRLVYCSVAGNGFEGPRRERPGFDPLLQARSGAMAAQGGDGPPVFFAVPLSDHAAALLNAYGVLAGIWMRQRSGEGCHVRLSLTNSTLAAQSGQFLFGDQVAPLVGFQSEARGVWSGYGAYVCKDGGWLFIACQTAEHWSALAESLDVHSPTFSEATHAGTDSPITSEIGGRLAQITQADALRVLKYTGVPCGPVRTPLEVFSAEQVLANGLLVEGQHVQFGSITQTGLLAKFSHTPGTIQRMAPLCGEHGAEILREIGLRVES